MSIVRGDGVFKRTIRSFFKRIGLLLGLKEVKQEIVVLQEGHEKTSKLLEDRIQSLHEEIRKLSIRGVFKAPSILARNEKCRVLFIVHAPQFWISLEPIYFLMKDNPFFEPIIFSIPGRLLGSQDYTNTSKVLFENMEGRVIIHENVGPNLILTINAIQPHVIFKQTPWEGQYPPELRTEMLDQYRICYVPYGIHTTANEDSFYGDELHIKAWRLYCANKAHLCSYRKLNPTSDVNAVISGYPKFEQIIKDLNSSKLKDWPVKAEDDTLLKIIWAPHHSVEGWLGFCTFHDNYSEMLSYAKNNPRIQIVLRPHPAMFETLIIEKKISSEDLKKFIDDFTSLPNTYLDSGDDYVHLFKHSDLLVTDGVGFLFEYLLTGKPIIHTDSKVSVGFLPYYDRMQKAFYKAYSFDDIEKYINDILIKRDPLVVIRNDVLPLLHPVNGIISPSAFIMEDIQNSFSRKEL